MLSQEQPVVRFETPPRRQMRMDFTMIGCIIRPARYRTMHVDRAWSAGRALKDLSNTMHLTSTRRTAAMSENRGTAAPEAEFDIELSQQGGYRFEARFDSPAVPPLVVDEHPPLGGDGGPSPARVLAVAVGHCLSASLLFALRKFRNDPGSMRTSVHVDIVRNEARRLRVGRMAVALHLGKPAAELQMLERILAQFEDFCTVTASIRGAVAVEVRVYDSTGALLHGSPSSSEV
jgi:uncharacterized OsmC-like protein